MGDNSPGWLALGWFVGIFAGGLMVIYTDCASVIIIGSIVVLAVVSGFLEESE